MARQTWPGARALGLRIRQLRVARGWSQQELADRLGCSRVMVSYLEGGQRRWAARWIDRLAVAFNVPPAALTSPINEPVPGWTWEDVARRAGGGARPPRNPMTGVREGDLTEAEWRAVWIAHQGFLAQLRLIVAAARHRHRGDTAA